jgi:hypothetical protein
MDILSKLRGRETPRDISREEPPGLGKETQVPESSDRRTVKLVLSPEAYRALKEIADTRKVTFERALLEALATEQVIARELAQGSKILIQKKDHSFSELVAAS